MQFFRSRILAKPIAIAMSLLMSMPFTVLADDGAIARSASSAQQLGSQVSEWFSPVDAQATLEDVFVDYRAMGTEDLESVFGEDIETRELGQDAQTRLNTEASNEGEAYRTVLASGRRITPDLSSDPMFNSADQIRSAEYMDFFRNEFSDCSAGDVFEEQTGVAHIPKYRTCERLIKPTDSCQIEHKLKIDARPADIVFVIDKSGSMSGQVAQMAANIAGFMRVLSQQSDADIRFGASRSSGGGPSGGGSIHLTHNTEAVASWISSISGGSGSNTIGATRYAMQNMSWRSGVDKYILVTGNKDGVNYRSAIQLRDDLTALGFQAFIFHDNAGVKQIGRDMGNSFSATRFFDVAKTLAIVEDYWTPEECWNRVIDINNGQFCEGAINITQGSSPTDCATIDGFNICPGDPIYEQIKDPPMPGVHKLALKVEVSDIDCSFNEGQMDCWTDPQGKVHCPVNEGGNDNSCEQYEEDPACGFISQSCMDDGTSSTGSCYVFEEIWDCGHDVTYPTAVHTGTTYECPGPVACMGTECFDNSNTKSGDFAQAVAMLQVAQFAEHDMDCSGDCKVFPGQAMECKKALGGYVDCCEAPDGVSLFDYVNLTMSTLKMASQVEALSRSGSLFAPGYWQAAKAAAGSVGSSVVKGNWGGIVDAATGSFTETLAGEVALGKLEQFLMQTAYDAMQEMGASAAADAVFSAGTDGAVSGLSSNAAMAMNVIGFIYTAYVIADLMINIIWECEPEEFELGAKKETRQCTFVGSYCASEVLGSCIEKREAYCCYSSVVARIIHEQGKPQLGQGFGSAKSPSCDAMSIEDMGRINWDAIDLTEWIGMLSMTGNLPTIDTVDLEQITGSGSGLGNPGEEGERLNTYDRNIRRLDGIDLDEVKKDAEIEAAGAIPR